MPVVVAAQEIQQEALAVLVAAAPVNLEQQMELLEIQTLVAEVEAQGITRTGQESLAAQAAPALSF
jgi:hypothetical protein